MMTIAFGLNENTDKAISDALHFSVYTIYNTLQPLPVPNVPNLNLKRNLLQGKMYFCHIISYISPDFKYAEETWRHGRKPG